MKHIYKLIYFSCFTVLFWSCEDDMEKTQINPENGIGAVINTPLNNDVFMLNIEETQEQISLNPLMRLSQQIRFLQ